MAVVQLVGGKWGHKAEDVNAGWFLVRQRRSSLLSHHEPIRLYD